MPFALAACGRAQPRRQPHRRSFLATSRQVEVVQRNGMPPGGRRTALPLLVLPGSLIQHIASCSEHHTAQAASYCFLSLCDGARDPAGGARGSPRPRQRWWRPMPQRPSAPAIPYTLAARAQEPGSTGTMIAPHIHGLRTDEEFSNFMRESRKQTVRPGGRAALCPATQHGLLTGYHSVRAGAGGVWLQLVSGRRCAPLQPAASAPCSAHRAAPLPQRAVA